MTDDMQKCLCQYCGTWNLITNKQCTACGATLSNSSNDNSDEEIKHFKQANTKSVSDSSSLNNTPLPAPPSTPHWKQVLSVLLIICSVLVIATVVRLFASATTQEEKVPTESLYSTDGNSKISEDTAVSEIAESSIDEDTDGRVYTAPALRLTSFGGETSGNELIVHSNVHDNYNNEYDTGLGGSVHDVENCTEYLVGDQYKYFSFRVVLNYDRRTDYHPNTCVRVYADGSQIYVSPLVHNGFKPEDVTLNISGVERLKVGICGRVDIRVVDPVLHNDEGYEQYSTMVPYTNKQSKDSVPLSYLEYWNGSSAEGGLQYITTTIYDDSSGKMYDAGYAGTHENQDNWVEYDITDCGFKKISGTIIMNANPEGVDVATPIVAIYDSPSMTQLYRSNPIMKGSSRQHFEVNLENSSQFRLQISGKYNIRLVDCNLSK